MSSRFVAPFVAVVLVLTTASPAFAQSFKKETPQSQPSAVKIDLSARAAGIHTIAATTPATPQNEKKPILKRPVTWVVIAAVAVVGIYFATRGGYGTPGSGY